MPRKPKNDEPVEAKDTTLAPEPLAPVDAPEDTDAPEPPKDPGWTQVDERGFPMQPEAGRD